MRRILLFGAGKATTTLIQYLGHYCEEHDCELLVCDRDIRLAQSKVRDYKSSYAITFDVTDESERQKAISKADIVISMLPASLHILVARDCILYYKDLLTASYVDPQLYELDKEIKNRGILFLSEMGLDPGIDHMSAMRMIDHLRKKGACITSFLSYCGGLVAPENDDNPWRYKITWNPMNVVEAGTAGARYLENGQIKEVPYPQVFSFDDQVLSIGDLDEMAWYANRDSLPYQHLYGLQKVHTFIRATLRYPQFNRGWYLIASIGLADLNDGDIIENCNTVSEWFGKKLEIYKQKFPDNPVLSLLKEKEPRRQLEYLGLFKNTPLPENRSSSGKIMLSVLVDHLHLEKDDRDMVVMEHQIGFTLGEQHQKITSTLIVKGEDHMNTAMAKTVGLPLAIATTLILEGSIKVSGLHIPIIPEIYEPVLEELEKEGIVFEEKREQAVF